MADLGWELIYAAKEGNIGLVKELIERGANVNMQDNNGWTVLIYAARYGHNNVVKELIEAGANVDIRSNDGLTALRWCERTGK